MGQYHKSTARRSYRNNPSKRLWKKCPSHLFQVQSREESGDFLEIANETRGEGVGSIRSTALRRLADHSHHLPDIRQLPVLRFRLCLRLRGLSGVPGKINALV
mmetsp:Transcript_8297/g.15247  ORF Transcript_8297/g.15247 Transcript_8297/m.15247 type:complete len:103 (+) Transcript_8297:1719-2027(+)